jgi:uncharacterized membrane protein
MHQMFSAARIALAVLILVFVITVAIFAGNSYGWFFEVNFWQYENAPNFFVAAGFAFISISIALLALVQLIKKD